MYNYSKTQQKNLDQMGILFRVAVRHRLVTNAVAKETQKPPVFPLLSDIDSPQKQSFTLVSSPSARLLPATSAPSPVSS